MLVIVSASAYVLPTSYTLITYLIFGIHIYGAFHGDVKPSMAAATGCPAVGSSGSAVSAVCCLLFRIRLVSGKNAAKRLGMYTNALVNYGE